MNIGEFLKACRINSNLTQKNVSDMTGINIKSISSYENNETEPPTSKFLELCRVYSISPLALSRDNPYILDYSCFSEKSKKRIQAIASLEKSKLNQ